MKKLAAWIGVVAREAAWAPILVFGLHVLAARVFRLYALFPQLDIFMHFIGGVAIAYFFHHAVRSATRVALTGDYYPHPVFHWAFVFALVGTSTVFWEFAEFLSDRYFGTRAQRGVPDTMGDMFFGLLGGLAFIGLAMQRPIRIGSVSTDR